MRGDFSRWKIRRKIPPEKFDDINLSGVLQQQGKIFIDPDWNEETLRTNDWQDTSGKDTLGANVAAIPVENPNGFKIDSAFVSGHDVNITVRGGRAWVDGLLVRIDSEGSVSRTATYLLPPIQDSVTVKSIGDDVRDALVLEVWREEINGFQMPEILIEPALGGPDTTEMINTAMAFRLFRLGGGQNCSNISSKLKDDPSNKCKLTVSLELTQPINNDCNCPTIQEGGYTGLEHNLYRIEIAHVKDVTSPMFKFSRFNGGLVGRGFLNVTNKKISIKANLQAIITSNLKSFYVEIIEFDPDLGRWLVTYGDRATLGPEGELQLANLPLLGEVSDVIKPESLFFRLWDDVRKINDFTASPAVHLIDGIHLKFNPPPQPGIFVPGDYWIFSVRAGGITNPTTLIDNELPHGIQYHRVPLGILKWNSIKSIAQDKIDDCREIFEPLTNIKAFYYVSGDGQEAPPDTKLPFPLIAGVAKANNKPVSNVPIRFTVISGGGTLDSNGGTVTIPTGQDGLASCVWILGNATDQQVKAEMLDSNGNVLHLPLLFNAKSEIAQGNCTIVVHPNDDVNEIIAKLPTHGGKICFTSGTFNLKKTIQIFNRSDILIEGTGSASRIIIDKAETAFHFKDCKKIHINQLSIVSTSPLPPSEERLESNIYGVLMFSNCSEVKVTHSNFGCSQRYVHIQSCLSFNNDHSRPGSQIEISSCTFHVGSMQIGILLVNVHNVIIKDNFLDVIQIREKIPFLFKKSLVFKNNLAFRDLIFAFSKATQPVIFSEKALSASIGATELLDSGISFQKSGKTTEAFALYRKALTLHKSSGQLLEQVTSAKYLNNKTVTKFNAAFTAHKKITSLLEKAIDEPESLENSDNTLAMFQRIKAAYKDIITPLEAGISLIGNTEKAAAKRELSSNVDAVFSTIIGDFSNPQFTPSIAKVISTMNKDLNVGYQGIVLGGSGGKNVRIHDNTINGMIQGIHIGASIRDPKKQETKFLNDVSLERNNIEIMIPRWYSRQKHGIFVGNADVAVVKDNIISILRMNYLRIGLKKVSPTVGIQMFGAHGRMISVSGNVVSNANVGLRFCTTGYIPPFNYGTSLRVIHHNLVHGSDLLNYDLSGSQNQDKIRFIDRDNVP